MKSLKIFATSKAAGQRLAMVSLYDAPSARLACDAGVDALLVGDSLGNVLLGFDNTLAVTLEDMVRHTGAVVRGVAASSRPEVPVIADLPLGTYQGSRDAILHHAVTLIQAGALGVKLEGAGAQALRAVKLLGETGIPVMGHLGFVPQSSLRLPGVVHPPEEADRLLAQARALQQAGCFAVVLEVVRLEVAAAITRSLQIPTIGIGSGPACDGQVLIWHDMLGLGSEKPYRFVKQFAALGQEACRGLQQYVQEVRRQEFPTAEHGWAMPAEDAPAGESK